MPTFIPPECSPKTPWSERDVFQRLENDQLAQGWTVFHSLGIGAHKRKPHGEIDFVVLIPDIGIVIIEVKGGKVSCKNGIWQTIRYGTNDPKQLKQSPWMQAQDNARTLSQYLTKKLGNLPENSFNYSHLVILPGTQETPTSSEFNPWELATERDLDEKGVGQCIRKSLEQTIKSTGKTIGRSHPGTGVMRRIRKALRPDFDLVLSPSFILREGEHRLLELTEEQFRFLDIVEANRRAIARGAAGTGKTVMAIEFARREYLKGRNVGIFCFNKLLGDWLKLNVREIGQQNSAAQMKGELTSGTFHSWLRSVVRRSADFESEFESYQIQNSDDNFAETLFHYGELALLDSEDYFDTIIIDEIQDFAESDILSIVDASLKGGLASGSWLFLGDFSRQSFFSSEIAPENEQVFTDRIEDLGAYPTKVPLSLNCRNTRRIARSTISLSGFNNDPFQLGDYEGLPVDLSYYATRDELYDKVVLAFRQLIGEGIAPQDIVLLGNSRGSQNSASIADDLEKHSNLSIVDWGQSMGNDEALQFASVRRFKGMESKAVIVADVADVKTDKGRSLLYVALSRARSRLIFLAPENLRKAIDFQMALAIEKELGK